MGTNELIRLERVRTSSCGQLKGPSEALCGQPEVLPEAVTPALNHDGPPPVSLLGAPVLDGELAVFADDAEGFEAGPPRVPVSPVVLVPPPGFLDGHGRDVILEPVSEKFVFTHRFTQKSLVSALPQLVIILVCIWGAQVTKSKNHKLHISFLIDA